MILDCLKGLRNHLAALNPNRKQNLEGSFYEAWLDQMERDANAGTGAVFVAEHEGQIVGYAYGYLKSPSDLEQREFKPEKTSEFEDLFVLPDYREQGIGRLLAQAMIHYFKTQQYEKVSLKVLQNNAETQAFYRNMGFVADTIEMVKSI